MNKKIILPFVAILVLAVAMVGAASADEVTTVDTVEVRGEVKYEAHATAGIEWDAQNFAAFWYDLDDDLSTENLTLTAGAVSDTDRTIDEDNLTYTTHPVWQEYELHENEKLVVDGDDYNLSTGYYIEGWMAEKYIAVNDNADTLVKLLVEFEDDDKKTLSTGESWDLGSGFALTPQQIDLEGDKVWLRLEKDGKELDSEVVTTGEADRNNSVYTYTADLANEEDVPVFSCLVDAVFRGTDSNIVQVEYVFLIDNDVLEIDTSETYGAMEVMTASSKNIILKNDESTLDLDDDTTEHIMGNMYFKTGDNDAGDDTLKFYPFVEYTIGEGAPAAPEETPTEVETPEANVTPTAEVTPTPEPTAAPEEIATAEETATAEPTATKKKAPGFEAIFAIAGLLAVAYLVLRQRE
jgi:S-layer protein (TIGR01567 family)